ncbi:hypothetical protein [Piscinibacter sp. XHJ-5]|uniref:hypothetical protein n=1 Tax=Piscinibacter sp. XHJ-5 TaxID=3037797 RepID=UPI002452E16E|nr:hypothetical protein [Piscinibacter sp. XHJ-5]
MSHKNKPESRELLTESESALRSLIAEASGSGYAALKSLAEAQLHSDGVVVLEGDYGGQIYVVVPASLVQCGESGLSSLLAELDAMEWEEPEGARVYFERQPHGSSVPGGMGGGLATDKAWVHPRLEHLASKIEEVLAGVRTSVER